MASPLLLPVAASPSVSPCFKNAASDSLETFAFGPKSHSMGIAEGGLGLPPGFGNHGHGRVPNADNLLNARHLERRRLVEAGKLAAGDRASLNGRKQHPRQLQVDAVDLAAVQLTRRIEALQRFARNGPILRVSELDVLWRLNPGRGGSDLAEGCAPAQALARNYAVSAVHSSGRTLHSLAAAAISISRAAAPPCLT